MKKVYIEVMGCQMNKSDAERMYGMLEHLGYTETPDPKEADMLIINTCSVRQLSEDKAFIQFKIRHLFLQICRILPLFLNNNIFSKKNQ